MARTGFSEIINVSFRNNKSGSIINSFGTLIMETAEKITVSNKWKALLWRGRKL